MGTYPPHKAFLPLRLYLCFSTLVVSLISLASTESLNASLINRAGPSGYIVTWILVFFAVIGMIDAIINDILPDRWSFPTAAYYRHLGFIAIASMNLAFIMTMAKNNAITWLAARYLLDACFCTFVAYGHIKVNLKKAKYQGAERRRPPGGFAT